LFPEFPVFSGGGNLLLLCKCLIFIYVQQNFRMGGKFGWRKFEGAFNFQMSHWANILFWDILCGGLGVNACQWLLIKVL